VENKKKGIVAAPKTAAMESQQVKAAFDMLNEKLRQVSTSLLL
jgi:hypothetical protein